MGKVNRVDEVLQRKFFAFPDWSHMTRDEKAIASEAFYQGIDAIKKALAGSAETGGEKAAPQTCEEGFEFFVIHRLHRYGLEFGNRIEDLENFMHDVKTEHRKRLATFPRSSQNQTVSSGVEGAHEGTTADKSELLPTQLPKGDL